VIEKSDPTWDRKGENSNLGKEVMRSVRKKTHVFEVLLQRAGPKSHGVPQKHGVSDWEPYGHGDMRSADKKIRVRIKKKDMEEAIDEAPRNERWWRGGSKRKSASELHETSQPARSYWHGFGPIRRATCGAPKKRSTARSTMVPGSSYSKTAQHV